MHENIYEAEDFIHLESGTTLDELIKTYGNPVNEENVKSGCFFIYPLENSRKTRITTGDYDRKVKYVELFDEEGAKGFAEWEERERAGNCGEANTPHKSDDFRGIEGMSYDDIIEHFGKDFVFLPFSLSNTIAYLVEDYQWVIIQSVYQVDRGLIVKQVKQVATLEDFF